MSLCGWTEVDVEVDVSKVTCRSCLAVLAGGRAATTSDFFGAALKATLAPSADFPPRMTPILWTASCRGALEVRCGRCPLCRWEDEAQRWSAVRPWTVEAKVNGVRVPGAPQWPSLRAALVDLAMWERDGRALDSSFGRALVRLKLGNVPSSAPTTADEGRTIRRAVDVVPVRRALERAYPEGAHRLSQEKRVGLLVVRTAGLVTPVPTYDELAAALGETVGELRALVRKGRALVTADLEDRGLIRVARGSRGRASATFIQAGDGA
jgi:hypothetical protein